MTDHPRLFKARPWFAWRPVRLTNERIAWLRTVIRHVEYPPDVPGSPNFFWRYTDPLDVIYRERRYYD